MLEIPDFDQLAVQISGGDFTPAEVAEQLRQVWNARGAADAKAVDVEAHRVHAEATRTGRTDLVMDLVAALKKLDR